MAVINNAKPMLLKVINKPNLLSDNEYQEVIDTFVPTRNEALNLILEAQQITDIPNGGSMRTTNIVNGTQYPFINQMIPDQFESFNQNVKKLHVNISKEGNACNELLYMLCGTVNFFFCVSGKIAELKVTAANNQGWILIFRGDYPHGGIFAPHLKQLAVVIGPNKWEGKHYEKI